MGNLLRFEWRKLWQQKSLYICFGIGLAINFLALLSAKNFGALDSALGNMCVALNSGYTSFLGIYIALYACQDSSQQTIKNIYARGYSRSLVYWVKYAVSLGVTLATALLYWGFNFLLTCCFGGEVGSFVTTVGQALALQLWVIIGYHGLYFGVAMLLNKLGGSIAINLIGVDCVFVVLSLIISLLKIDFNVMYYNLSNLLTDIVEASLMMPEFTSSMVIRGITIPLLYVVTFVGAGWLVSRRRDV